MKRKEIVFEIDRHGRITSHIKGIKGSSCADVAKELKNGIGSLTDMSRTSEFYEKDVQIIEQVHINKTS